jgi:glutathione S-transferase
MMKLELISFRTCPFVQRAVILLLEKNVSYTIRYVEDLENPPEWFIKISPRERVPVLVADGVSLFESQAICEFLDEITPGPRLMSENPIERARERAWFAYASEDLFFPAYALSYGETEAAVIEAHHSLRESIAKLNGEMKDRDYLSGNGKKFGMADVAMAPFLYRAEWFRQKKWVDLFKGFSNIEKWAERVTAKTSVQNSVPKDFSQLSLSGMQENKAWILTHSL